jgi:hypothetical protein
MPKPILMMLLVALSSNAAAEWVKVGANVNTTTYVDYATLRKSGTMARMWYLTDFKKAVKPGNGEPHSSSITQMEFDCLDERERRLYHIEYSGNMGDGKTLYVGSKPADWSPIATQTISKTLWRVSCIETTLRPRRRG